MSIALVALLAGAAEGNWPQWRGPLANGFAPTADPPQSWAEGKSVRWKVAIPGRGVSSPVVWGDRIFLMTAVKTDRTGEPPPLVSPPPPSTQSGPGRDDRKRARPANFHKFIVLCLDRSTGRTIWERISAEVVPHEGHQKTSSFANASPVTDGRFVYCSFGSRGIYCYDMDGNRQWSADLGQLHIKFGFGEGSSPALHGDTLVVKCDHEGQSFITALDAATGKPKWKAPRDETSTWNTPLIAEHDGRTQVITTGARRSRSYDLKNGELIWEHIGRAGVDAIPSPLRVGDLAVFVTGFSGKPAYAIPLDSTGEVTSQHIVWTHAKGTPQVSTPVLVGDRLFFTKDRAGIVTCINARTGEVIIDQERVDGLEEVYASPVATAGRVYFTGRNGVTVVIDASADEVRVLAENRLDESIDSSPAIAGREIFIRGEKSLYCIRP